MVNYYYILAGVLVVYFGALLLLNAIPHVSIKSLGWLSIKHVKVTLPSVKIHIGTVKLRMNLSRGHDQTLKLFKLHIDNVRITLLDTGDKPDALSQEGQDQQKKPNVRKEIKSLLEIMTFKLPTRIYDIMVYYRVMNQFEIHLVTCSIRHETWKPEVKVLIGYSKVQASVDYMGNGKLTFMMVQSQILDGKAEVRFFRNLELLVDFDTVTYSHFGDHKSVYLCMTHFKTAFSIGRLTIPLDILSDGHRKTAPTSDTPIDFLELADLLSRIEPNLIEALERFQGVSFALEDFALTRKDTVLKASNLAITLGRGDTDTPDPTNPNPLELNIFSTGLSILNQDTKCFELPSANLNAITNLVSLFRTSIDLMKGDTEAVNYINWTTKSIITNPTLHLYYDQIEYLQRSDKHNAPHCAALEETPKKKRKESIDLISIVNKLRVFTMRFAVVDIMMKLHLPKVGSNPDYFNRESRSNWIISFSVLALLHRFYTSDFASLNKRRKFKLNFFLQLKSVKIDALGNTLYLPKASVLFTFNVAERTLSVKVISKLLKARSINDAIFMLTRRFRDRSNKLYNEKVDRLSAKMREKQALLDPNGEKNAQKKSLIQESKIREAEVHNERLKALDGIDVAGSNGVPGAASNENADTDFDIIQLFDILPSFVCHVRVKIASIETDFICKDGLPSQIIFDETTKQEIDLADYKRGVFIRLNTVAFEYKKKQESLGVFIKALNCYTISECRSEYVDDFDEVITLSRKVDDDVQSEASTLFSDFSVQSNNISSADDEDDGDLQKIKKILHIHDILLSNRKPKTNKCPTGTNRNKLYLTIPEIDGRIDIFFVWCSMYAITLLHLFAPEVKRKCTGQELARLGEKKKKVNLSICIDSISLVLRLPNAVDIMIETDGLRSADIMGNQAGTANFVRFYVVHPATKLWTRLLIIEKPILDFTISSIIEESTFIVDANTIRLNIPHQFLFYTVIDNLITLGKSVNQIQSNFKNMLDTSASFEKIWPQVKPAILLPLINVKTRSFGISLENDPFENELSIIYELGAIEQQIRMKKLKLFEQEAEKIREAAEPDIEKQSELTDTLPTMTKTKHYQTLAGNKKFHSPLRKIFSDVVDENEVQDSTGTNLLSHSSSSCLFKEILKTKKTPSAPSTNNSSIPADSIPEEDEEPYRLTYSEAEEKIRVARERLNHNLGTTWIRKFKIFNGVKNSNWKKKFESLWGEDKINSVITNKFNILNYSEGPALLAGNFRQLDLLIKAADIPDVDKFLHDYGSKQPTLEYSILVPLYFELKCSSMNMLLKDYPLPFISFPQGHDRTKTTVDISGRLVVNEQMVRLKEEMRYIFVPFSPAIHRADKVDNFYSVNVPRTLATIKLTADVKCNLDTDRACMINWNKSYQPAISAMSAAFDNFTKPEIDDSPLGWWDKMALMLHGKMTLDIPNELCLHIKSSLSPYETNGRASGFVFSWKNNVHLGINETGNTKEVIRLESDDFVLAIPNYCMGSKSHTHGGGLFDSSTSLTLDSLLDYESNKFRKRVVKLSSSERVVWLFGMQFERNKNKNGQLNDSEERVSTFKNHWDVVITNPAFDYHPDSFEGFRSDYIHMQLSVISKSTGGEAFNAGYLTPLTFSYFFYWWDSLNDGVSLPIRHGKLFNTQVEKNSINTGPHLFTIKYLLVFEPLTISHTYMHNTDTKVNGDYRTAFTGLKGKFSSCQIFLRQRKEYVRYINERLGINNRVYHLKMNQAEINADGLDLRLMNAIFQDKCPLGTLMANFEKSRSNVDPKPEKTVEFEKWFNTEEVYGDDFSWVDLEDFMELEREVSSSNPILKVYPFCYSPNFNYVREFNFTNEGKYPFGYEEFNHYDWNVPSPEETQVGFLKKRMRAIEHEIHHNKDLLKKEGVALSDEKVKELRQVVKLEEKKLEVIETIWQQFVGENISAASSIISENLAVERRFSRALSVYSSRRSALEQEQSPGQQLDLSPTKFHNRFIVHNLQLKWNNDLRDLFTSYVQKVSDRKAHVHFMTRKAVELVESVVNENSTDDEKINLKEHVFKTHKSGEEVIDTFEDEIGDTLEDQESVNQYLIKLVHPQIQMISQKDPDSSLLVTSRDLEIRIISVTVPGLNEIISESALVSGIIESRYGVLFRDSHVFVFRKDEVQFIHPDLQYGADDGGNDAHWPPWVECEVWYDSSWAQDQLLAEKNTMALVYKKPNFLFSEKKAACSGNEITIHLAKIVLNSTSAQYNTMFYVVTDVLVHSKTNREEALERLYKIVSLSDSSDFQGLDLKVVDLQNTIRTYKGIALALDQYGTNLSVAEEEILRTLEFEMYKKHLELDILMRGVTLRSAKNKASKHESRFWSIIADQVIWHFLDDSREPFVDFAMANAMFTRIEAMDGSNLNEATISMIQGFNLQEGAKYPELLRPYLEFGDNCKAVIAERGPCEKPIFKMTWRLLDPIGGIPIMQEAKMSVEPLEVALDYVTGKRLFEFLFPHIDEEIAAKNGKSKRKAQASEESTLVDELLRQSSTSSKSRNPFRNFVRKHTDSDASSIDTTISESSKHSAPKSDSTSSKVSSNGMSSGPSSNGATGTTSTGSSNGSSGNGGSSNTGVSSVDTKTSSMGMDLNLSKFVQKKKAGVTPEDDVALIMNRSSHYISIVDVELEKCKLFVSFSAPGGLHVLNVHNLHIQIPTLRYKNKMWSGEDLILRVKKDLIKIMLQHTGKILTNKLKLEKKRHSKLEPLKQVSNYASFMTLDDLQDEGRARNAGRSNTDRDMKHHHIKHLPHVVPKKAVGGSKLNSAQYFEAISE